MASTLVVQDLITSARAYPELTPVLGTGGWEREPALSIINDVMQKFLSQGLDWKFNRSNIPSFLTVALQQDYVTNLVNLSWLEQMWRIDINNSANPNAPKPIFSMETVRDLQQNAYQGVPFNCSWVPNTLAIMGVWQKNTAYPCAYGVAQTPASPIQQFIDVNGNILFIDSSSLNLNISSQGVSGSGSAVTLPLGNPYGISGNTQPSLPPNAWAAVTATSLTNNIATYTANNNFTSGQNVTVNGANNGSGVFNIVNQIIVNATPLQFTVNINNGGVTIPQFPETASAGLNVIDGTVRWTVANPNGIALRLAPLPAFSGISWLLVSVYQRKPPIITSLQSTLYPIPDEYAYLFRQGFIAFCKEHAGTKDARDAYLKWEEMVMNALRSGDRERESKSFYPSEGLMTGGGGGYYQQLPIGPGYPFQPFPY
jgi:hypothetical protein